MINFESDKQLGTHKLHKLMRCFIHEPRTIYIYKTLYKYSIYSTSFFDLNDK